MQIWRPWPILLGFLLREIDSWYRLVHTKWLLSISRQLCLHPPCLYYSRHSQFRSLTLTLSFHRAFSSTSSKFSFIPTVYLVNLYLYDHVPSLHVEFRIQNFPIIFECIRFARDGKILFCPFHPVPSIPLRFFSSIPLDVILVSFIVNSFSFHWKLAIMIWNEIYF